MSADEMSGTLSAGSRTMDLAGRRTAAAEKKRDGEDDGPAVTLEELEAVMSLYRGPVREHDVIAITGATVYTVTGDTLEDATVVVRSGKIAAVGTDIEVFVYCNE